MSEEIVKTPTNFIREAIKEDIESNRFNGRVTTRFRLSRTGFFI
jgi:hypothetical protein